MKRHLLAMIIMASGSALGVVVGLIIGMATGNWITALVIGVIIIVVTGLIGFLIAAINMAGMFKDPEKMFK